MDRAFAPIGAQALFTRACTADESRAALIGVCRLGCPVGRRFNNANEVAFAIALKGPRDAIGVDASVADLLLGITAALSGCIGIGFRLSFSKRALGIRSGLLGLVRG